MAVFLALGVGIFIGAGMLDDRTLLERQQALIRSLEEDFAALRRDTALLRSENRRLSSELARYGQAEQALASLAVEGRLTGRRIALVVLGEAEAPLAQEAAQLLQAAAARPGARLVVDPGLAQLVGRWPEVAAAALGTPGRAGSTWSRASPGPWRKPWSRVRRPSLLQGWPGWRPWAA